MINFSSVFCWHADRTPDRPAMVFEDQVTTYKESNRMINAFAAALQSQGGHPKQIVAILLHNSPEFIFSAAGSNRAGLAFLPLNYRLSKDEIRYILHNSGASFLITESSFQSQLDEIRVGLPNLQRCIKIDGQSQAGWTSFSEFARPVDRAVPDYDAGPEDLHRLVYTSGTTAHPKGVMISYSNMYWKTFAHVIELETNKDDVAMVAGPLYHVGAFDLAAAHVMLAGGTLVILRRFDPIQCLEAIQRYKATVTWLAPSMLNSLMQVGQIESYDLHSLRLIVDGGEKMPERLIKSFRSAFPNAWYADAYGLTETVSGDTILPKEAIDSKLGSVGKPVLFLKLKIVDANGNEVPVGSKGEIVLRGPKVFQGYWRDEELTKRVLIDGWFHTGDVGQIDEDGFLYIVDRIKDMIKSGGENIASLEVERVLNLHPDVLEVAVIGIPDPKWGEVPVAVVVPKTGSRMGEEDLVEFCKDKLAHYKTPKRFILQNDPLPRNPSGKVLKRVIREQLGQVDSASLNKQ